MAVYPGGTVRDPGVKGYSFSQNFLSDLGMTVTHGGHSNTPGAGLFIASFGVLAFSFVTCAVGFVRFHASSQPARHFARVGAIGALVVGVSLVGAALNPPNVSLALHMRFARLASATAPASLLLFALAAARDGRLPAGVSGAWVALAFTAAVWFAMRWGPDLTTEAGLAIQAIVQKIVAIVGVATVTYQCDKAGKAAESQI